VLVHFFKHATGIIHSYSPDSEEWDEPIHFCKINSYLQISMNGDPPLLCPLQDKVETKFIPTIFVGCENYDTTWKGCYGYN